MGSPYLIDLRLKWLFAILSAALLFLFVSKAAFAISSAPSGLQFRCSASNKSTLTWTRDPGAAYYSLRLHKQGTNWEACSTGAKDGPNNACIDISNTATSHTFTTDAYGTYDVWIHSRGADGSFGPGMRVNGLRCAPNCSLTNVPSHLKPGKSYSISASFSSSNGELGGEIFRDNFNRIVYNTFGGAGNRTTNGTATGTWTPSTSENGSKTVYCRAWNDAIAECRPSNLVDSARAGTTQFNCVGPTASKQVCVDGLAPDVPVNSSLSCVYSTTQNGTKRYKVGHYWGRVADIGCTGLGSTPYWSQMSTTSNFSTIASGSTNTWKSNLTNISTSTFAEGTVIYARVKSRDALDNQSAWTATKSITLNPANCAAEPSTPVVQMCPGVQHCNITSSTGGSSTRFEYCGDCSGAGCAPGYRCPQSGYTCKAYTDKVFFFDEVYNMPCTYLPLNPDLTISGQMNASPASVQVGQAVNIKFTIINNGKVASPMTYIYTNQAGGTSTIASDNTCTGSTVLAPGGTCVSSYNFTFSSAGSKKLDIFIDSSNKVTETNENNNKFSKTITVVAPPTPTKTNTPTPTKTPTPTIQTTGVLKLTMSGTKPSGWGWETAAKGVNETTPPTKGWVNRGTNASISLDTKVTSEYWVRLKPVTGYTTSLKLGTKVVNNVKIIPGQTVTLTGAYISVPTPTNTKAPTATPKPPTATPKPPTATPKPPTATPKPPTATPTPKPATPTPKPPTPTDQPAIPTNTQPPLPTVDECPNFSLGNATCDAEGVVNNEDYVCWRTQYLSKISGQEPAPIGNCKRVANFDSSSDGVSLLDFAIWRINALRQSAEQ